MAPTGQAFIPSTTLRNAIPNLQLREMPGLLRAPGIWGGVGSSVLCLRGLKAHSEPYAVPLVVAGLSCPRLPLAAAWGGRLCRASSAPHSSPLSAFPPSH